MPTRQKRPANRVLFLCTALIVGCAAPTSTPTRVVPAGFQDPAAVLRSGGTLADVAFLVGSWEGSGLGGQVEETWSHAAGNSMMGTFRIVKGEQTSLYEFMLLEQDAKGAVLRFMHIDPGYRPWEEQALVLRLASVGMNEAVFEAEDPAQNPARMTYSITTDGKLSVVVASRGREGVQHEFGVKYTRRKKAN
jgi:hypothetical protein